MKYIINGDVVLSRPLEGPLAAQINAFAKWYAIRDTRRCHGTGECCSPRVLVDGSGGMLSGYTVFHPSIRHGICDLAVDERRCTTATRPR
jgi:hypothetical protein